MILVAFSIRDNGAGSFSAPFYGANDHVGARIFGGEVNRPDPQNLLFMYPAEFELYRVGQFDSDTGLLQPVQPVSLGLGSSFKSNSSMPAEALREESSQA